MKTIYKCKICGYESYDKEKIINCEKQGVPKVLVKKGYRIKFKDCDKTPIAKERLESFFLDHNVYNAWSKAYSYGQQLTEYEVIDVVYFGHYIYYYLGRDGYSTLSWSFDGVNVFNYPVISGNEFMRKVLELYN